MEQHPVPQNVTTFQFRLIGDMTIKQFGYLAAGLILAYVAYKLPLPFFFSWPLAFVFALGGFGFAFMPIEDRPMDVWVLSFLKNVYSPTQFIWTRETPPPAVAAPQPKPVAPQPHEAVVSRPKTDVLQNIFRTNPTAPPVSAPASPAAPHIMTSHPVSKKPSFFEWLASFMAPHPPAATPRPQPVVQPTPTPTPSITGSHLDMSMPPKITPAPPTPPAPPTQPKETDVVKQEIELDKKAHELEAALEEKTQTSTRVLELQKQLMEVLAQRDRMEKELAALRGKTTQAAAPAHTTTVATPQVPHQPTVRIITPEGAVKAGLPRLTTFPNVVTGVTRDADNNMLPGVLITIRDKDGVPLRALKTNRLGQFAASTPIANGTYFVEVEDPRGRFVFDRIQITLNGSIVPALEILAKSQKQVAREKLAKEIFGGIDG